MKSLNQNSLVSVAGLFPVLRIIALCAMLCCKGNVLIELWNDSMRDPLCQAKLLQEHVGWKNEKKNGKRALDQNLYNCHIFCFLPLLYLFSKSLLYTICMPGMVLSNRETEKSNVRQKKKIDCQKTACILAQHIFMEHICPYFPGIIVVSSYCLT